MARVLTIDDADDVRLLLTYNLTQAGHEVFEARTGSEGLRIARETHLELVLLDLMLPDLSGTEVIHQLTRTTSRPKVMIVSACSTEEVRLSGLAAGADDYVAKPFSVRELMLRVRAVLRRGRMLRAEPARELSTGTLKVDRESHRVWVAESEVSLTALEFRLLLVLGDHPERVLSREELLERVWGNDTSVNARTVDAHVKRLRDKLGAAGHRVETVRGVGYRFCARTAA